MSRAAVKLIFLTLTAISTTAVADISQIKNNYTPSGQLDDSFSSSNSHPGFQVDIVPPINWKPQLSLDNASGKPSLDLSNSFGNISGTTGINDSIKDQIGNAGTPTPPPPVFGNWRQVWKKYIGPTGDIPYPVQLKDMLTAGVGEGLICEKALGKKGSHVLYHYASSWGQEWVQARTVTVFDCK